MTDVAEIRRRRQQRQIEQEGPDLDPRHGPAEIEESDDAVSGMDSFLYGAADPLNLSQGMARLAGDEDSLIGGALRWIADVEADDAERMGRQGRDMVRDANPLAFSAGQMTGAAVAGAPVASMAAAPGLAGVAGSALVGAGEGAVSGYAEDGTGASAGKGALIGGALGGAGEVGMRGISALGNVAKRFGVDPGRLTSWMTPQSRQSGAIRTPKVPDPILPEPQTLPPRAVPDHPAVRPRRHVRPDAPQGPVTGNMRAGRPKPPPSPDGPQGFSWDVSTRPHPNAAPAPTRPLQPPEPPTRVYQGGTSEMPTRIRLDDDGPTAVRFDADDMPTEYRPVPGDVDTVSHWGATVAQEAAPAAGATGNYRGGRPQRRVSAADDAPPPPEAHSAPQQQSFERVRPEPIRGLGGPSMGSRMSQQAGEHTAISMLPPELAPAYKAFANQPMGTLASAPLSTSIAFGREMHEATNGLGGQGYTSPYADAVSSLQSESERPPTNPSGKAGDLMRAVSSVIPQLRELNPSLAKRAEDAVMSGDPSLVASVGRQLSGVPGLNWAQINPMRQDPEQ